MKSRQKGEEDLKEDVTSMIVKKTLVCTADQIQPKLFRVGRKKDWRSDAKFAIAEYATVHRLCK